MTSKQQQRVEKCIGPRVVGGHYRSGYWGITYVVVSIDVGEDSQIPWSDWSITERDDADGRIRVHCTAWDTKPGRPDKVL